jgi:hypothetical protein
VLHLFVECKHVSQIWLDLQQWLTTCGYIHTERLQSADIILGKPEEDIAFNFTILIAKFTIYRCSIPEIHHGGRKIHSYNKQETGQVLRQVGNFIP